MKVRMESSLYVGIILPEMKFYDISDVTYKVTLSIFIILDVCTYSLKENNHIW